MWGRRGWAEQGERYRRRGAGGRCAEKRRWGGAGAIGCAGQAVRRVCEKEGRGTPERHRVISRGLAAAASRASAGRCTLAAATLRQQTDRGEPAAAMQNRPDPEPVRLRGCSVVGACGRVVCGKRQPVLGRGPCAIRLAQQAVQRRVQRRGCHVVQALLFRLAGVRVHGVGGDTQARRVGCTRGGR